MNNKYDKIDLMESIYQIITKEVSEAIDDIETEEVLKRHGFEQLIVEDENDNLVEYSYYDKNNSKILVIGDSRTNKDALVSAAKSLGIRENKLEFELDYAKLTNYNFGRLRGSMSYSDILVGPMPHKTVGIEGFSSFLAMAETTPEDFPPVIRLESSNDLKITKDSFTNGLLQTRMYNDIYNN